MVVRSTMKERIAGFELGESRKAVVGAAGSMPYWRFHRICRPPFSGSTYYTVPSRQVDNKMEFVALFPGNQAPRLAGCASAWFQKLCGRLSQPLS